MASYCLEYWSIEHYHIWEVKLNSSDLKFWWQLNITFLDYPKLAIVLFRLELYTSREKKKIEFQNLWVKWYKDF